MAALLLTVQDDKPKDLLVTDSDSVLAERLAFSGDGKRIIAASRDGASVKTWTVADGKLLSQVKVEKLVPLEIVANQEGTRALTLDLDKILSIETVKEASVKVLHQLDDPKNGPAPPSYMGLVPMPGGTSVFTAYGINRRLVQVDSATMAPMKWFPLEDFVPGDISTDGTVLVGQIGEHDCGVFNLKKQKYTRIFKYSYVGTVRVSADGRFVACSGSPQPRDGRKKAWVRVWEIEKGKQIRQLDFDATWVSFALSPKGGVLVTLDRFRNTITFWDVGTGKSLWEPLTATGDTELRLSPDGTLLAYWDRNNAVHVLKMPQK